MSEEFQVYGYLLSQRPLISFSLHHVLAMCNELSFLFWHYSLQIASSIHMLLLLQKREETEE